MAFTDYIRVDELHLAARVSLKDDAGEWVTGKVIELALLGDDHTTHGVMLQLDKGAVVRLDRTPDTSAILEWEN